MYARNARRFAAILALSTTIVAGAVAESATSSAAPATHAVQQQGHHTAHPMNSDTWP